MTNISTIPRSSLTYPALLAELPDAPKILYALGNTKLLQEVSLLGCAIVGTRKPTAYGQAVTEKLSTDLSSAGLIIVSGMARGIDGAAHEACLKNKGKTIAVLASGLDQKNIYPPEHRGLAKTIIKEGGLLLSEYEAGTPPLRFHFPQRNRIIAGLSKAIIVVEASEKSGALITASLGLDYNREILAVPGLITNPVAIGPNKLIAQGATLIAEPKDVLRIFGLTAPEPGEQLELFDDPLLQLLTTHHSLTASQLAQLGNFDISWVSQRLTELELNDIIVSKSDGAFTTK
jgi:DNA processing protein